MRKTTKKTISADKKAMTPGKIQDLQSQFRKLINKELQRISPSVYPHVWAKVQDRPGYVQMEDRIISMCIVNNITPSAAIGLLESEL